MRFMVIVKANKDSEAGVLPDEKILTEMGKYNEELVKAGVMLAGEGLHASSKGVRVKFDGTKRIVTDGPFAETKELIAGFWLWQVKSKEEAIEWLKRAPFDQTEVEIRQVFEAEDFGPAERGEGVVAVFSGSHRRAGASHVTSRQGISHIIDQPGGMQHAGKSVSQLRRPVR